MAPQWPIRRITLTRALTHQLNCRLRNHAVLRQDAPIILQLLSTEKKLLPLLWCVGSEGFCLEVLDHIEPRANSETDHSITALLGNVDLHTLWGAQKTYGHDTNTRFHRGFLTGTLGEGGKRVSE